MFAVTVLCRLMTWWRIMTVNVYDARVTSVNYIGTLQRISFLYCNEVLKIYSLNKSSTWCLFVGIQVAQFTNNDGSIQDEKSKHNFIFSQQLGWTIYIVFENSDKTKTRHCVCPEYKMQSLNSICFNVLRSPIALYYYIHCINSVKTCF